MIFGSGGRGSVYPSYSAPRERIGSIGRELQQAVVSWCYLLIARSRMHVCLGVDRRLGSSSAQRKAPGNTPRATARPTQDGPRGLQRQWRRESSETVPTENPRRHHYLEQGDLQGRFPRFNSLYYCSTTSIEVFDGRRGKNEE